MCDCITYYWLIASCDSWSILLLRRAEPLSRATNLADGVSSFGAVLIASSERGSVGVVDGTSGDGDSMNSALRDDHSGCALNDDPSNSRLGILGVMRCDVSISERIARARSFCASVFLLKLPSLLPPESDHVPAAVVALLLLKLVVSDTSSSSSSELGGPSPSGNPSGGGARAVVATRKPGTTPESIGPQAKWWARSPHSGRALSDRYRS